MPSAQKVEIDSLTTETDGVGADLYALLHEIHASNVSHLSSLHGRGKVLFEEGEPARGVYLLRSGKATVSISSREGRVVILGMAQTGAVLGLNSVLRNTAYHATVRTLSPCRADFIARAELIGIMERSPAVAHTILRLLSRELTVLTDRARLLLLAQTAGARLASLLLEWYKEANGNNSPTTCIDRVFTQEQIAQSIGSSRETVTRLLGSFCSRQIIGITPDSILIHDRDALEAIAVG